MGKKRTSPTHKSLSFLLHLVIQADLGGIAIYGIFFWAKNSKETVSIQAIGVKCKKIHHQFDMDIFYDPPLVR